MTNRFMWFTSLSTWTSHIVLISTTSLNAMLEWLLTTHIPLLLTPRSSYLLRMPSIFILLSVAASLKPCSISLSKCPTFAYVVPCLVAYTYVIPPPMYFIVYLDVNWLGSSKSMSIYRMVLRIHPYRLFMMIQLKLWVLAQALPAS
jgi:hypothetical protein